ncbi:MAG: FtsX-like permease family protein [Streptosporangiales bacterium]|nr:FtsX-like permease family protein [Streptosporangiales bacterium]
MRAQFVLSEIWIGLRRNLTMTIAVILTTAVSLALFGTGLLIRSQVNAMKDYWFDKVEVTVFLCTSSSSSARCKDNGPATDDQKGQIQRDLQAMPQVRRVYYESQEAAYQRFKSQFRNSTALVQVTRPGDIPDSFRVKLSRPQEYRVVASAVAGRPGVDSVLDEQASLERFFTMLNGLRNAAIGVALLQIVAAILLIGNTIRLAAYNRRRETGIMRLVGASNFYIQLPFLLEGAVAGLIGGGIASTLLVAVKLLFVDRLRSSFLTVAWIGWESVIQVIALQLIAGVLISALASFVTLRRYLRV